MTNPVFSPGFFWKIVRIILSQFLASDLRQLWFFPQSPGDWEPFRSLYQISAKYSPEAKTRLQIPELSTAVLSWFIALP
jgi:hypothetical protein